MHVILVAPSQPGTVLDIPANRGFELRGLIDLLDALADHGLCCEWIDSSALSEERISTLYWQAAGLAVGSHIRASRVFGSRRTSGLSGFGKEVPALLVYDSNEGPLIGIFPHASKFGPLVTIAGFLTYLADRLPTGGLDAHDVVDLTVEGDWREPVDLAVDGEWDHSVDLTVD
jgi:hypothetical protein